MPIERPARSGIGRAAWAARIASTLRHDVGGKGATFGPAMSMCSDRVSEVAASQPSTWRIS